MSDLVLLFDIGNSRIKVGLFRGRELVHHGAAGSADDAASLAASWRQHPEPGHIGVAVTGHDEIREVLVDALAEYWPRVTPAFAVTQKRWGTLVNAYEDPSTMGVDRWLAMIAAWSTTRGACCVLGKESDMVQRDR